jgi:hypothetical protein
MEISSVDIWLNARFALVADPLDCIIGAYGTLTDTYGLSDGEAFEKIKAKCGALKLIRGTV